MDEQPEEPTGPLVKRPVYPTPRKILQRGRPPRIDSVVVRSQDLACDQEGPPMDPESMSSGIPRAMPVLAKQEAAIEDQGRGALLPVSEDTNGSRTSGVPSQCGRVANSRDLVSPNLNLDYT
ncbi:hypothetical protein PC116_g2613 [Phytophthora cactorum]|nr:hypothetical protein Pcac1_g10717 [Phytophthora cactorum]KAG4249631.1 hypothetical protein PC116_g2613 [Phytophthora cactorum]